MGLMKSEKTSIYSSGSGPDFLPEHYNEGVDSAPPYFIDATALALSYFEGHPSDQPVANIAVFTTDNRGVTRYEFTEDPTDQNGDPYFYITNDGTVGITAAGVNSEAGDFETGEDKWKFKLSIFDQAGNSATIPFYMRVLDVIDESAPHNQIPIVDPNFDPGGADLWLI